MLMSEVPLTQYPEIEDQPQQHHQQQQQILLKIGK